MVGGANKREKMKGPEGGGAGAGGGGGGGRVDKEPDVVGTRMCVWLREKEKARKKCLSMGAEVIRRGGELAEKGRSHTQHS